MQEYTDDWIDIDGFLAQFTLILGVDDDPEKKRDVLERFTEHLKAGDQD